MLEAEIVVAATVLGVVAPTVPFITAPVSVLLVSVCVLLSVVMFVGVMMDESVAMISYVLKLLVLVADDDHAAAAVAVAGRVGVAH